MSESKFHHFEQTLENLLLRIKGKTIHSERGQIGNPFNLTQKNKEKLLEYYNSFFSGEKNISVPRQVRIMGSTALLLEWLGKDFDKATEKNLLELVAQVNRYKTSSGKPYSIESITQHKVSIKRFWKWLNNGEEHPFTKKIKCTIDQKYRKLPSDMYEEQEVKQVLDSCLNPMHAAYLALTYETGARCGETGNAKIEDLEFKNGYGWVNLSGKTGSRRVFIMFSVPYLGEWLQYHPTKNDKKSPLFIISRGENKGKQVNYSSVRKLFIDAVKRSDLKKPANLHILRHSRATFLANHLTESQLKEIFGWSQGSRMVARYIHLSGKHTEKALKAVYGIKDEEQKEETALKPTKCTICQFLNKASLEICQNCHNPLTVKTALGVIEKGQRNQEILDTAASVLTEQQLFSVLDKWWEKKQSESKLKTATISPH